MAGCASPAEGRYHHIALRNAEISRRLAAGDDPSVIAREVGVSRKRLREIALDNFGGMVAVPAWVPACLHEEYRAVAEEDGEEDAAAWARIEKRKLVQPRAVASERAPAAPPEPEPVSKPVSRRPVPLAPGASQAGHTVQPGETLYALPDLMRVAAKAGGVSVADLKSESRAHALVRPRQIYFWLAKRFTRVSLPAIGRSCGGRDHTTALHGVRTVDHVIASTGLTITDDPTAMARALMACPWPKLTRRKR